MILALLLAVSAFAQPYTVCKTDADCAPLGAGYQCLTRKVACPTHPESSTCAERRCRRKPGGAVKDADRACKKDADCAVVVLRFQCMYCAREGDFESGVIAAASKKRAKAYEGKATPDQQRQCATAGPCAQTGKAVPRCRQKQCVAEYVPGAP